MVVVPTSNHVTLNYGYTPVDWIGFILSLFGLLGVVLLWRLPRSRVSEASAPARRRTPLRKAPVIWPLRFLAAWLLSIPPSSPQSSRPTTSGARCPIR